MSSDDGYLGTYVNEALEIVTRDDLTYAEVRRAGRWLGAARWLQRGEITPAQFRNVVRRWAPIKGELVLSDPYRTLALLEGGISDDLEFYTTRHTRRVRAS